MSKVIGTASAFSVLRAAVRKDMAPAVIADSVRDVAYMYAMQGGSKPLLDSLLVDCKTGANGKARTMSKGSLVACVFVSLMYIAEHGPVSLARTNKRTEETAESRETIAHTFADGVVTAFTASVEAGAVDRKAKTAAKKAEATADSTVPAGTVEETQPLQAVEETNWKGLYLAALAENEALKVQIQTLQTKKAKVAA